MGLARSAHVDTFARDGLPPEELWPELEFTLPELQYPARLNAAVELLDRTADRLGGDRIALRVPADEAWGIPEGHAPVWTYEELRRRSDQVARLLTEEHGLVPGNRVLLRIPNNAWAVICWFAVVKAGGVVVTSMVAWRAAELKKVCNRVQPSLMIVDHRYVDVLHEVESPARVVVLGGPDDQIIEASTAKPEDFEPVDTAADDVVLFAPTSGTTGEPKIAAHFHRDLLAIADTFARHVLDVRESDVFAGSPPLAFTFGLGGLVVFPFRHGASTYLREKAGPMDLVRAIEEEGVSALFTAPTGYRAMLKDGHASVLGRLRIAVSAGEHLSRETFEAVKAASGISLIDGIGATEMLHVFISSSGDAIVGGSTGRVVPGYRAAVLDDEGNELPAGEPGRLAVIGPTGCRYLDDERQRQYVQRGWNITGDTYVMDADGYFYFQGRSDDMIVAAGYNVGAPEVESVLDAHPSVLEAAVIGRPDPDKGMILNAFVRLGDGIPADDSMREELRLFVADRLAPYKIPRRFDFVESLPRNPSGKLQRFVLRERATREATQQMADRMSLPESTLVRTARGDIAVRQSGSGDTAFLLHGIGSASASFWAQFEALSKEFRLMAWDAPGYGGSPGDGCSSIAEYADRVIATLEECASAPVHLLGVSWGGVIATRVAADRPDLVASLTLVSSTVGRANNSSAQASLQARTTALSDGDTEAWARERAVRQISDTAPEWLRERVVGIAIDSVRPEGYASAARSLAAVDHGGILSKVQAPTLVLAGTRDPITGISEAETLATGIRGARLAVIAGGGHLLNQDSAAAVNDALATHWRRELDVVEGETR